jgi:predicted dehydrogenase
MSEQGQVLRIAAIGYGDIAQRRHFPDLKALAGTVEFVAIHGRERARLEACAARFGIPRWHTDAEDILSDRSVDAVLVLTPPDSHLYYAQQVIHAGKHLMVEKPLVCTVAEAQALLRELERQQAVRPITCFPLPHVETAETQLVRRLLQQDAIGEVTSVECHRSHRGPTHADWFYDRARSGGGVLIDLGIYQLAVVAALFGPALSMSASCTRHFPVRTLDNGAVVKPDVEDSALLTLSLTNGIAVSINANWNSCWSHHETRARVVVIGRRGILHFGVPDRGVYLHRPDGNYGALSTVSSSVVFDGYASQRLAAEGSERRRSLVGDFVNRITAGDTSTRAVAIQAHVLEIVEKAYKGDTGTVELMSSF